MYVKCGVNHLDNKGKLGKMEADQVFLVISSLSMTYVSKRTEYHSNEERVEFWFCASCNHALNVQDEGDSYSFISCNGSCFQYGSLFTTTHL